MNRDSKQDNDTQVVWRCCECHESDIHGGVSQSSKTKGTAGRCYWCDKPVDVYFGPSRKIVGG
jgi:hypothetical protein